MPWVERWKYFILWLSWYFQFDARALFVRDSILDQYNIVTAPLYSTRVTRMLLVIVWLLFVDLQRML
jgi:hypothetical protein